MADFEFREDLNNRQVFVQMENLQGLTERSIRHGFFALGKDLKITASKQILFKPKSGRTYIRRDKIGRRRRHVASAPGETHANMTGAARRSLGWQVTGFKSLEWGYGVSTLHAPPDYVEGLEFGTRRAAPRPSLQNAMRTVNRNAERYFVERFGE